MFRSMRGSLLAVLVAAGPAFAERTSNAAEAVAAMRDRQGRDVGMVTMIQTPAAVVIRGDLSNLEPGWHAIHVHETGKCEPPFDSAGGHFNPEGGRHGFHQPLRHAGDLPNIYVSQDGTARFEMMTDRFTIADPAAAGSGTLSGSGSPGAGDSPAAADGSARADATRPVSVFDQDGAAVVVHARPDDYASDPSGDSGDRIACGVLERR